MDDLICKQTLFRLVCYLPWNQTPQKNRFILDQWISVIRHRRLIYFCGLQFSCFLFGKSALCATSRLTTTASFCKLSGMAFASLPMCQCASVPFCTSLESGSYGVTNPDSLLCHRSPRLQCCADKLQNHPCLSCHCCKISFSANTPQWWKYNSYFRIVMLNSCRVCRKAKKRKGAPALVKEWHSSAQ